MRTPAVEQAVAAIYQTASRAELDIIFEAFKAHNSTLQKRAALAFHVGQRVSFMTRRGVKQVGTVRGHNPKTVRVDVEGTEWRVGASLLTPVEAA